MARRLLTTFLLLIASPAAAQSQLLSDSPIRSYCASVFSDNDLLQRWCHRRQREARLRVARSSNVNANAKKVVWDCIDKARREGRIGDWEGIDGCTITDCVVGRVSGDLRFLTTPDACANAGGWVGP